MSIFKFKQFEIEQEDNVFKIGTDGLLLSTWVNHTSPTSILDIGTGTGLIGLVLAQRYKEAIITAIDINPNAIELASKNFERSPWSDRLCGIQVPLNELEHATKFDLIISNPPFFENRLKSGNQFKDWARHTDTLPINQLIQNAKKWLSPNGTFATILPVDEFEIAQKEALKTSLHLHRICKVRGNENAPVKRILAEFTHQELPLKKEALTIEKSRHLYTDEYIQLAKDFLLKL